MTIRHAGAIPAHWNYFLALEDDIQKLSRWIEFAANNETVYSIELARLLMAAAAEADVVAKALCARIRPAARASSIGQYRTLLTETAPLLVEAEVVMPRYGMTFRPWSNWAGEQHPDWWSGNNKVKHHRAEHFKEANLKNVLNAAAALLLLLLLHYGAEQVYLYPPPRIYEPRAFGTVEGEAIRLWVPDGAHLPWARAN